MSHVNSDVDDWVEESKDINTKIEILHEIIKTFIERIKILEDRIAIMETYR